MEQGTTLLPNRGSFDRLTAAAIWYPGGYQVGIGGYSLGVIDTQMIDEGISREKVPFSIGGQVVLGYDEVVSVAPILTLKGKQFMTLIVPLLLMGTRGADVLQAGGAGLTTVPLTAVLGREFDLGYRKLFNVVVVVGATTMIEGVDYFLDAGNGQLRFPQVAAGINAGDAVVVTFNKPALTRNGFIAFNQLNQQGDLRLLETSGLVDGPTSEFLVPGSLSRDKASDGDPMKTNQWSLRFAIEGQPSILRAGNWDELLLDDLSVLEFS